MTQRQMFEKSFERPRNYFQLNGIQQWRIDSKLGILDWTGSGLNKEDYARFDAHYGIRGTKVAGTNVDAP